MRRGVIILALGFVGAVVGYYCLYLLGTATPRAWLHSRQPELAWLKNEFKLSDSEFARILQLHQGYLPRCKERCRHIEELNDKLMKAIGATTQMTPWWTPDQFRHNDSSITELPQESPVSNEGETT